MRHFTAGNLFILLLLTGAVPMQSVAQPTSLSYFRGSYAELKTAAQVRQMPFIMVFAMDNDVPSNKLLTTLMQPEVSAILGAHFLVYRVADPGIALPEPGRGGVDLATHFNVMLYPTTIIFGPNGDTLERFAGVLTPEAFLELIRPMVPPPVVSTPPAQPPKPTSWGTPDPPIRPEPKTDPHPPVAVPVPVSLPVEVGLAALPTPAQVREHGLQAFTQHRRPAGQGFALQTAAFGEYANAYSFAQGLQQQYAGQPVCLLIIEQEPRLYKVLLGTFATEGEAEAFRRGYNARAAHPGMVIRR